MKFSGKVGNGLVNKWLNFGDNPDHYLDTGIFFRICHYWEIRKVVNGHSFILIRQMAALVTCLGGGLHCSCASSYWQHCTQRKAPVFKLLRRRFWGFSPPGATSCTDGGENWRGGVDQNFSKRRWIFTKFRKRFTLIQNYTRMWAIPNVMAALPNIGGALCSMP